MTKMKHANNADTLIHRETAEHTNKVKETQRNKDRIQYYRTYCFTSLDAKYVANIKLKSTLNIGTNHLQQPFTVATVRHWRLISTQRFRKYITSQ